MWTANNTTTDNWPNADNNNVYLTLTKGVGKWGKLPFAPLWESEKGNKKNDGLYLRARLTKRLSLSLFFIPHKNDIPYNNITYIV